MLQGRWSSQKSDHIYMPTGLVKYFMYTRCFLVFILARAWLLIIFKFHLLELHGIWENVYFFSPFLQFTVGYRTCLALYSMLTYFSKGCYILRSKAIKYSQIYLGSWEKNTANLRVNRDKQTSSESWIKINPDLTLCEIYRPDTWGKEQKLILQEFTFPKQGNK